MILSHIYETLSDAVGPITVVITLILCVIAYFAYSWIGVLVVAIGGLGVAYLLKQARYALEKHDESRRETAKINKDTQQAQAMQENEFALREELDKNCRELGCMNAEEWERKLPNYKNKLYQSSFDSITKNFAQQMEQQEILQNDDWFQPFFQYILNKNQATPTKLLSEVSCPQLNITHITPDLQLLKAQLKKYTKRVSEDVPALLKEQPVALSEPLYVPTKYAKQIKGAQDSSSNDSGTMNKKEFDINDL